MSDVKERILIVAGCLVLILALIFLVKKRKQQLAGIKPPKVYTAITRAEGVTRGDLDVTAGYLGEIVPVTETSLSSKVSGFIRKINVNEGDKAFFRMRIGPRLQW